MNRRIFPARLLEDDQRALSRQKSKMSHFSVKRFMTPSGLTLAEASYLHRGPYRNGARLRALLVLSECTPNLYYMHWKPSFPNTRSMCVIHTYPVLSAVNISYLQSCLVFFVLSASRLCCFTLLSAMTNTYSNCNKVSVLCYCAHVDFQVSDNFLLLPPAFGNKSICTFYSLHRKKTRLLLLWLKVFKQYRFWWK